MWFDDVDDGAVSFINAVYLLCFFIPDEPVAVVGARHNEFVGWANEVDYQRLLVQLK